MSLAEGVIVGVAASPVRAMSANCVPVVAAVQVTPSIEATVPYVKFGETAIPSTEILSDACVIVVLATAH